MELNNFLIEAHKTLDAATVEDELGNPEKCIKYLDTLEALIALFAKSPRKVADFRCGICGCTDIKACPDGCFWITPVLCSACRDKF